MSPIDEDQDEDQADTIRLRVPAEAAMRPVVEVAVGVLARRCGLTDLQVREARALAGEALVALADGGAQPVTVHARAARGRLSLRVEGAAGSRQLTFPGGGPRRGPEPAR
jgi:hypothetical protein